MGLKSLPSVNTSAHVPASARLDAGVPVTATRFSCSARTAVVRRSSGIWSFVFPVSFAAVSVSSSSTEPLRISMPTVLSAVTWFRSGKAVIEGPMIFSLSNFQVLMMPPFCCKVCCNLKCRKLSSRHLFVSGCPEVTANAWSRHVGSVTSQEHA